MELSSKGIGLVVVDVVDVCKVTVNADTPPYKQSYKVNFDLFKKLALEHHPAF